MSRIPALVLPCKFRRPAGAVGRLKQNGGRTFQTFLSFAGFALLFLAGAPPLPAQSPLGSVTGLALDPSGAPVPEARITL